MAGGNQMEHTPTISVASRHVTGHLFAPHHTKTNVGPLCAGPEKGAICGTGVLRALGPAAAPEYSVISGVGHGIGNVVLIGVGGYAGPAGPDASPVASVQAPFLHISVHIVETPCIGCLGPDPLGPFL